MSSLRTFMTADELLHLPNDGYRYELINGGLTHMTPAGGLHGVVAGRLQGLLFEYLQPHPSLGILGAAATGFHISAEPDTVRAPEPVVEVLSPFDTHEQVRQEVTTWLATGTQVVWVVNPTQRTVTAYRSPAEARVLTEADILEAEDVIPGFRCPVRTMFP